MLKFIAGFCVGCVVVVGYCFFRYAKKHSGIKATIQQLRNTQK